MSNDQLAVLLQTKARELKSEYTSLFEVLDKSHGVDKKAFLGVGTYRDVSVLTDLNHFIDSLDEDAETLRLSR